MRSLLPIAEARYLEVFWKKLFGNPGEIVEEDLCVWLEYFADLRVQHGLVPSAILGEDTRCKMLAGLKDTRRPLLEPSAKKSVKRRQRQTKIVDKRRAAAAHTT